MSKILVVDDEADIRLMLRLALESAGHEVFEAAEGEAALGLLEENGSFDALILDIRLPGMSGWDVLDSLRVSGLLDRFRVIVMSAHLSEATSSNILEFGCRAFVSKPFSPRKLVQTLDEVLAG